MCLSYSSVFVSSLIKLSVYISHSYIFYFYLCKLFYKELIRSLSESGRVKIEASICTFHHKPPTHVSFFLPILILSSLCFYFSPVTSLKYTHTSLCSYLSYSCLSLCQKLKFPQCLLSPKINDNMDDFSWSEFCQIIRRHFDCIHSLLFVSVRTLQPSAFIQESEFALLVHCPPFFNHLLKFLFWKWET